MGVRHLVLLPVLIGAFHGQSDTSHPDHLRDSMAAYAATVRTRAYSAPQDGGHWWGMDQQKPERVCSDVTVTYKNKPIPVPRSAYADLSDVNLIAFQRTSAEPRLLIEGGDAGTAYRCYLIFKKGRVVRRRVEDGEFPANFYEVTGYTSIPYVD